MRSPRVSVVMPCYDAEATIDEAILSILGQTCPDWELLALDDGSRDGTRDRLRYWAGVDERITVIERPHAGMIATLNAGWRRAAGTLIARMDADDKSAPDRLSSQSAWLDDRPDTALVASLVEGFPAGEVQKGYSIYIQWLNSLVTHEEIGREIFVESPVAHPSAMVRKTWLERLGGYQDHGWPEDYDLWLRMYLAGARLEKVPRVLLYWREHAHRATRTDSRYSVKNFLRAKAHYLMKGPLRDRDAVVIWGAGQMGRRLSKHLLNEGAPLSAFVEVDPAKIGRQKRGRPVIPREELLAELERHHRPALIAAVGSRGARAQIRAYLESLDLREGKDWWAAA